MSFDCTRRRLLQAMGTAAGLSLLPLPGWLGEALAENAVVSPASGTEFTPNIELELTAQEATAAILPNKTTPCYKYTGKLIKGRDDTLVDMPSYLGPTLRFRKGDKVRIHFVNILPGEDSIIHWHGLHVPEAADGHPKYQIAAGATYVYDFEILNRAGTYFYHPHAHGTTAAQVYKGLAGALIVHDDEEAALELPTGTHDIPLLIQDRSFIKKSGKLSYFSSVDGFFGDQVLINGQANFTLNVERGQYRLRCINGSHSRIYKLGWNNRKIPLTAIGTDGGLLAQPEQRPYIMLSPGERVDLWVDFSALKPGTELTLKSLRYAGFKVHNPAFHYPPGPHDSEGSPIVEKLTQKPRPTVNQGEPMPLLRIKVGKSKAGRQYALPKQLATITPLRLEDAANPDSPRPIAITMAYDAAMSPLLNDRPFPDDMVSVDASETLPLNSLQYFRIYHNHTMVMQNMTMMSMAHSIHLHGQPFQIVRRFLAPNHDARKYKTIRDGFIDSGWKDTVLVVEGEEVTFLKRFDTYPGLSVYHCHNLEHEDHGMMRNLLIQ